MIHGLNWQSTFTEWGSTMVLIAHLLERAKARSNIESDYRLAKVLSINSSAIYNYRAGLSFPNDKILTQLCALSGDDVAVLAAEIQAERSRSEEGKSMWLMIAKRLSGTASTAVMSVCLAIVLIAGSAREAVASSLPTLKTQLTNSLYIVLSDVLSGTCFLLVRLRCSPRQCWTLFKFGLLLCA